MVKKTNEHGHAAGGVPVPERITVAVSGGAVNKLNNALKPIPLNKVFIHALLNNHQQAERSLRAIASLCRA